MGPSGTSSSRSRATIAPPEAIPKFITADMLKEELEVVEHYLKATAHTRLSTNRVARLTEERDQLLRMIEQVNGADNHNSGRSSSTSESGGPFASLPSAASPSSLSPGSSSPDLFSSIKGDNPGSTLQEPVFRTDHRMAQELAYFSSVLA
jgi:hypothetical protein